MNQMGIWLQEAIRTTGAFILWIVLMALAAGLVIAIVIVLYAVIKAAVDAVKNGGKKKDE